jgi:acyl-coenzyme A thioesterase PaaI-like protein
MTVLSALEDEPDHVEVQVKESSNYVRQNSATDSVSSSHLPLWVKELEETCCGGSAVGGNYEELVVPEWKEDDDGMYRTKHGWHGKDLIHDKNSAVRILKYYVQYGDGKLDDDGDNDDIDNNTTNQGATPRQQLKLPRGGCGTSLTGIVHFTKRAESHMGYCHGGSMTSVLDDVIGWVAFLTTGECRPWSGYTVQVNCSLRRPIPVDSVLLVKATITHIERRKVSVEASIIDPEEDDAVHASGTGLVVLNRGVLPQPEHE